MKKTGKARGISKPAKRGAGGCGLLDSIMSSVSTLHSSLPPPRRAGASNLDDEEVASPYLIGRGSIAGAMPTSASVPGQVAREICKNPECARGDFETDTRHGDRICSHCGAVQNSRSIESLEEEHRTFADDDKSESKKRAEVSRDGRTGGAVGDKVLARAHQIATAGAEADGGLQEKDAKRLERFKDRLKDLASVMGLTGSAPYNAAVGECERFMFSMVAHASMCTEGKLCRFSKNEKPGLVAAAVMKIGLKSCGLDRQHAEMADFLKRIDEKADPSNVFQAARQACPQRVCAASAALLLWGEGGSSGPVT